MFFFYIYIFIFFILFLYILYFLLFYNFYFVCIFYIFYFIIFNKSQAGLLSKKFLYMFIQLFGNIAQPEYHKFMQFFFFSKIKMSIILIKTICLLYQFIIRLCNKYLISIYTNSYFDLIYSFQIKLFDKFDL